MGSGQLRIHLHLHLHVTRFGEIYVARHTENVIKTVQRIPGRGLATVYFPNEIVKIYVRREGVE